MSQLKIDNNLMQEMSEIKSNQLFFKKWANPGLFFVYFPLFKQTLQILQQI